MTELERLKKRLEGVKNFKIFYGPEAHLASSEEVARMINLSLDEIESGNSTPIDMDDFD